MKPDVTRSTSARVLTGLNGLAAVSLLVPAVWVAVDYSQIEPNLDRPDEGWAMPLLILYLVPTGLLFLATAAAFWRRWRARWWVQAVPLAVLLGTVVLIYTA